MSKNVLSIFHSTHARTKGSSVFVRPHTLVCQSGMYVVEIDTLKKRHIQEFKCFTAQVR